MKMQTKLQNNEYKETELGLLPREWEVVRLGDVADLQQGKTPRSEDYDNLKGFRIIKVKDFEDGSKISFAITGERIFVKCALSERYTIKEGDSLVLSAAHSSEIVGQKVGYVDDIPCEKAYFVAELIRVRPNKDLNPYLCFSILNLEGSRNQIKEEVKGGHLYPRNLGEIKIPLPPLPEQKSIAFVLSTIQTAKEKTEKVIQATKELKKSMMKHLFTYGPVSLEDAGKIKLKETEIGKMPEEWEVKEIKSLVEKTKQKDMRKEEIEFKYIDVSSIDRDNLRVLNHGLYKGKKSPSRARKIVNKDDVIIATVRPTLKRIAKINEEYNKEICSTAFCVLRSKKEFLEPDYLFYFVQRQTFIDKLSAIQRGASYPAVTDNDIKNQQIALPDLLTQQKIASILSVIDEKIQAEENKKKALEELFKSMLHNLMTAKIRVKDLGMVIENV